MEFLVPLAEPPRTAAERYPVSCGQRETLSRCGQRGNVSHLRRLARVAGGAAGGRLSRSRAAGSSVRIGSPHPVSRPAGVSETRLEILAEPAIWPHWAVLPARLNKPGD